MSEGAAGVSLERSTRAKSAGKTTIRQCALAGDPTSITGADLQGRTLRHVLKHLLAGGPVQLIHAHGTGTPLNDTIELAAIESAVGEVSDVWPPTPPTRDSFMTRPTLYSHKGALGHSLGSASLIAVVLSDQMHQKSIVPPNIQTQKPLPMQHVQLSSTITRCPIRRSLCLASGFGGASAGIELAAE